MINQNLTVEDTFCWNYKLAQSFTMYSVDEHWVVQMIQGYVGQFKQSFENNIDVYVTLICRRSHIRGGTRYIHRGRIKLYSLFKDWQNKYIQEGYKGVNNFFQEGKSNQQLKNNNYNSSNKKFQIQKGVDSDGYVANYCENEQIVSFNDFINSNILIRGSVPVFWEQSGMQAHLRLTRGEKLNEQAYEKHFNLLEKMYFEGFQNGRIHAFNLMQQHDKYEQMLSECFQANHQKYIAKQDDQQKQKQQYEFFDFHKRNSDLDDYVFNVMHNSQNYSYFKERKSNPGLLQYQRGFFRVNCKDCLDRTNSFMMRLAYWQIDTILKEELKIQLIKQSDESSVTSHKVFDVQNPFIQQLKELWIQNGNSISNLYAGTDATTKKASSGFQYKLNAYVIGMKRFVNCNLNDSFKMECINLITCQHFESTSGKNHFKQPHLKNLSLPDDVSEALENKRDLFQTKEKLKIQIVSWNVQTLVPQPEINFQKKFYSEYQQDSFNHIKLLKNGLEKPDIIVVGLQEIVKVSKFQFQNLFGSKHDEKATKLWTSIIQRHIQEQVDQTYMLIHSCDMMGNFLLVYANPSLQGIIKNVERETVRCGLANKSADLGAVICRLQINETLICFVHCILSGGKSKKKIMARYDALNHIHNTAFQKDSNGKTKMAKIDQSDLIFLFGDLNFRVDLDHDTAHEMIKNYEYYNSNNQTQEALNQLAALLKKDQLLSSESMKMSSSISNFIEGSISFPPNHIDRSKKKRPPSCNHIISYLYLNRRGRILFSLNNELSTINQLFYGLNQESQESDHKPVTSYFDISTVKIDFDKRNQLLQEIFREKDIINDASNTD